MRNVIFTVVLATLWAGAADVHAIEIIYPASHVGTVYPRISVVGRTGAGAIALDVNGKLARSQTVADGIFHLRVPIPYGLNHITVRIPADDPVQEEPVELQVLCGPKIPRSYEKVFAPVLFHGQEARQECRRCHDPQSGQWVTGGGDGWCYSCHADIQQQFRSHGAENEELCTMCHSIAPDMTRHTVGRYSDMNPCFKCHTDKIGEFAQDFIHGPVAGGTCTVCHNPHGSQFARNLKTPLPVLCIFCHTDVADMDAPQQHEPFMQGHCADCHDPHATANRWVLVKKTGELCLGCHQGLTEPGAHRHPLGGEKPKAELAAGLKLDTDGRLECLTCHRPHGSVADFLLRSTTANGCSECHPEF